MVRNLAPGVVLFLVYVVVGSILRRYWRRKAQILHEQLMKSAELKEKEADQEPEEFLIRQAM